MQKTMGNLNTIYISERVRNSLKTISDCAMTAVVAPMGYGKTTAVNWFLDRRQKEENAVIVRISIYSDNTGIFWKSVQKAFAFADINFLEDYSFPEDQGTGAMLADELCHVLADDKEYYIFFDDFHLLTNESIEKFLCLLANRLPKNVHIIVASRYQFPERKEIVRLGGKLHRIGAEHLKLNSAEIALYAHCCGTDLDESQIDTLLHFCEGWFSAVYLNLCSLAENGELLDDKSDIYQMFTAALIEPLDEDEREFLAVMGLADEFTVEMAEFVTDNPSAGSILQSLISRNAFVSRLADGVSFRFHHMMKECSAEIFAEISLKEQIKYQDLYGQWYEKHKQYLHALNYYGQAENYDSVLRVIEKDAGILLSAMKPDVLLSGLRNCSNEVLKDHPLAILVLMRRLFTWRRIPEMLELKELLVTSVAEHPDLPADEKGNLLGECDLIMSFLMYNDITEMSRLHRSASRQMTRSAVTIRNVGSWTFGSPSVLMMYYRAAGELEKEMAEMNDCMPHYYKITNGHGLGAELVMAAEAAFNKGNFDDAAIILERARIKISQSQQQNMAFCCDFLALRLSLCGYEKFNYDFAEKRDMLLKSHDTVLLNLLESTEAYYYALLGLPEKIPAVFRNHRLNTLNYFAPCKPMMEMFENQAYLTQGKYTKVIGRSEALLDVCEKLHYALVVLHIRLQMAAAYEKIGQRDNAKLILVKCLEMASVDGFLMPFVENYRYLSPVLAEVQVPDIKAFVDKIIVWGKRYDACCLNLRREHCRPVCAERLTDRELDLAYMLAGHLTNKEIAERLFLSEGTVKQYANKIYAKLHLEGNGRSKRKQLSELFSGKN